MNGMHLIFGVAGLVLISAYAAFIVLVGVAIYKHRR